GEILNNEVSDDTLAITAIQFEKTEIKTTLVNIRDFANSYEAGKHLPDALNGNDLKHILVLADGQLVNGSELVRGINTNLPSNITVSGGLAGDGPRFQKTLVGLNNNITEGNILAIGLYGKNLVVGHGSNGGWDSFGPYRKITKSVSNVLYELEGKSALDLYKQYLGDLASGLPGTALLFPLSIITDEDSEPVVRTILSVNEDEHSMTFAGDMPEGAQARLMKANFDRLIDAASGAAASSFAPFGTHKPQLALLISCVGRKLVLDQRVDEEVESVRSILGPDTYMTGFYSYGEISPLKNSGSCQLHNQTMTITTFSEI
ncbi:MAG: hypothetical protein JWO06_2460, partial [Bacteroidota bacterium]|nr:hypothetical protein [Bacteroidota bacterium]